MGYVELGLRVFLAVVFVVAAGGKWGSAAYGEFVSSTRRLLPGGLVRQVGLVAAVVLVVELAIVGLLAVGGVGTVAGFGLVMVSSTGFAIGIAAALRRGEVAPCRCLGVSTVPLGRVHVVRNVLLVAVALAGLILALVGGVAAVPVASGLRPGGAVIAVVGGALSAVLVVRLDEVVELFTATSLSPSVGTAGGMTSREEQG